MDPSSSVSIPSSDSFAAAASPYFDSLFRRRQQKKMSITQTYYLAHTARKKLTREASRADHDLRLLVGHANLLDSLMIDLADAEHEQERWFNQTVHGAAKAQDEQQSKHIQWATTTTIVEDPEEDWDPEDASDLDSDFSDDDEDEADDDDYDERDFVITTPPPRRRATSPMTVIHEQELMEDEDDDDDTDSDFEYDDVEVLEKLSLTRSPSRASQSPPELLADSDDDSEDDNLPPSPPQPTIEVFDEKAAAAAAVEATSLSSLKDNHLFEEQGYYVSQSPSHQEQTLIEAY